MTAVQTLTISPEESETRLDRWFKRHFPSVGHGLLEKWLRTGQVRVDGKRAKANHRLEAGQTVRVPPLPAERPRRARPSRPGRRSTPRPPRCCATPFFTGTTTSSS